MIIILGVWVLILSVLCHVLVRKLYKAQINIDQMYEWMNQADHWHNKMQDYTVRVLRWEQNTYGRVNALNDQAKQINEMLCRDDERLTKLEKKNKRGKR